jgi:hypothetical protein
VRFRPAQVGDYWGGGDTVSGPRPHLYENGGKCYCAGVRRTSASSMTWVPPSRGGNGSPGQLVAAPAGLPPPRRYREADALAQLACCYGQLSPNPLGIPAGADLGEEAVGLAQLFSPGHSSPLWRTSSASSTRTSGLVVLNADALDELKRTGSTPPRSGRGVTSR